MRIAALITWKHDADDAEIEAFLAAAPALLAEGPFVSVAHGVTRSPVRTPDKRTPKGAVMADWGFVAELADVADAPKWAASEPHRQLEAKLAPIMGTQTVLSW